MNVRSHLLLSSDQVSGKDPKFITEDGLRILKNYNEGQRDFFQKIGKIDLSNAKSSLRKHIPQYFGWLELESDPTIGVLDENHAQSTRVWLSHLAARYKERILINKFIILQNFTSGFQESSVFDIKVGGRNEQKKHKMTESVKKYCFKLNGCRIAYPNDRQAAFINKYFLQKMNDLDSITNYIAFFFYDGKNILTNTICQIRQKLSDIILTLRSMQGYRFISSSICFIYDGKNSNKADAKLIDFARVSQLQPDYFDHMTCTGLQNLHMILTNILQKQKELLPKLAEIAQFHLENQLTALPPPKRSLKISDEEIPPSKFATK